MKYCPNPACPTLKKLGMVAEYEDQVAYCDDCGTLLISADSPPQITSQPVQVAGQKSDFGEEAALLGTFESWEDAEACLEEFERFDIPAVVEETLVTMDVAEADPDATADQPAFNLFVRRQDLFQAMEVLQEMFGDDANDETDDAIDDE